MLDKALYGFTAVKYIAVRAGDIPLGQATDLYAAFCPPQIPQSIQIPQLTPLAGFQKFSACFAVRTAAANFFGIAHGTGLLLLMGLSYVVNMKEKTARPFF